MNFRGATKLLVHRVLKGAIDGAYKALEDSVVGEWNGELLELELAIQQNKANWWQAKLFDLLPHQWFTRAFCEGMGRHSVSYPVTPGPGPAYGTRGNSKGQGLQCIDKQMAPPLSDFILPRMIRTRDGRELLQHQLLKERETTDEHPATA